MFVNPTRNNLCKPQIWNFERMLETPNDSDLRIHFHKIPDDYKISDFVCHTISKGYLAGIAPFFSLVLSVFSNTMFSAIKRSQSIFLNKTSRYPFKYSKDACNSVIQLFCHKRVKEEDTFL